MDHLDRYLQEMAETLRQMSRPQLQAIAEALWQAYERDATIIVCGNGGSASTASHFACDLTKWTARPGVRRLRALALTESVPLLTAYANDQGYASVFVEQLAAHYRPGDVVVAISGSGNSANVLHAIQWANDQGAVTIGVTGFNGGVLARIAQIALHVENDQMPQVEDAHSTVCHALAVYLGLMVDERKVQPSVALPAQPAYVLIEQAVGERQ
jgi:D-sedoheptulose 7-phosphate isomerase